MGRVKWKANANVKQEETLLRRFRLQIAIAAIAVTAIGVFIYLFAHSRYQYGDPSTDYERAMADCLRDRTRHSDNDYANDEAAAACVKDIPGSR
jgi:nitrogen fixation-related uncharacterized protein